MAWTEEMLTAKFERGLRPYIREKLVALRIWNYKDMVDSALKVEQEREDFLKIQEKFRGSQQNQHRRPSNKKPKIDQTPSGGCSQGNNYNRGSIECYNCGKQGHIKRNCPSLHSAPRSEQAESLVPNPSHMSQGSQPHSGYQYPQSVSTTNQPRTSYKRKEVNQAPKPQGERFASHQPKLRGKQTMR